MRQWIVQIAVISGLYRFGAALTALLWVAERLSPVIAEVSDLCRELAEMFHQRGVIVGRVVERPLTENLLVRLKTTTAQMTSDAHSLRTFLSV